MTVECRREEHQNRGGCSTLEVCILIVTLKGYYSLRFFLALLVVDARREWEGAPLWVPRLILLSGRKKPGSSSTPCPAQGTELPQGFSVLSRLEGYVGQALDQAQLGDIGGSS